MNTTANNFSIEDGTSDDELDALIQEVEKFEEEMERHNQGLDKLFNLLDLALELYDEIGECKKNLEQLEKVVPYISDSDSFLLGCLHCNICSALEGFIHRFISSLIKNEADINEKNLVCSVNNDLGRKKKLLNDINKIIDEYKNRTINNPFEIARLCNLLFNLNIKYDESKLKKYSDEIIRVRNAFTHNNGYYNGTYMNINKKDVENLLSFIITFVNLINNNVLGKFDRQLSDVSNKHGLNMEQT